jgi:hypothetical protein
MSYKLGGYIFEPTPKEISAIKELLSLSRGRYEEVEKWRKPIQEETGLKLIACALEKVMEKKSTYPTEVQVTISARGVTITLSSLNFTGIIERYREESPLTVSEVIKNAMEKVEKDEMLRPEELVLKISNYQQVKEAAKLFQLLERKINTLPQGELRSAYEKAQRMLYRSVYLYLYREIFGVSPSEYPEDVGCAEY